MRQIYEKYTTEDHEVWGLLFERQLKKLQDKACQEYLTCMDELSDVIQPSSIPNFDELNEVLRARNGWSITVVPGLIPVEEFFGYLAERKFCSSTWLRSKAQLDYLEEPDMFHDTFGHIPLLMNPAYANFTQQLGILGIRYLDRPEIVKMLQRLYWFTIEFGVIQEAEQTKLYGAGILSSFQEADYVYSPAIELRPFNLAEVLQQDFRTDVLQTMYVEVGSFQDIYALPKAVELHLEEQAALML